MIRTRLRSSFKSYNTMILKFRCCYYSSLAIRLIYANIYLHILLDCSEDDSRLIRSLVQEKISDIGSRYIEFVKL